MSKHGRLLVGVAGMATVAVFILLAISGSLAYVTTHGASMEPRYHDGDLVLIRPSNTYNVGDVVAYRSDVLDAFVMHRIVGRDGDRYLFKGDNNSWIDPDQPTRENLIGAHWLRVPRAGAAVDWLGSHWPVPVAMCVVLMLGAGTSRRLHRRKLGTPMRSGRSFPAVDAIRGLTVPATLLPVAVAAAVAFAALGTLAYARPARTPIEDEVSYLQTGSFAYSAQTPAGPVYDGDIGTGDPLFLNLVDAADVQFGYEFESSAPAAMSGTMSLIAEIGDSSGWVRRVELSGPSPFDGSIAAIRGRLDLSRIRALIDETEALTGVHAGTYAVNIAAEVAVSGTVAGQPVAEAFAPRLEFQLDALRLRPTWSTADPSTEPALLAPSQPGSVMSPGTAPASLSALGRDLDVADARALALVGLLASTVALAVALVATRRRHGNEAARIGARHGHRIVSVAVGGGDANGAVVDVTTMDDLARLAEQYGCLILHHDHTGTHSYMFQVDRTLYRYRIPKLAAAAS